MEVSYTLTAEDLRAYMTWLADQPATKRVLDRSRNLGAAIFVVLAALFALIGWWEGVGVFLPAAGLMLAAGVFAFVTFGPRIRTAYVNRSMGGVLAGNTAYLLGPRTARISAEGFALSGPGLAGSYSWQVVDHVTAAPSGVYVFMGAQQAHVVPRSAFASPEELQAFASTAEQYLRAPAA